MCQNAPGKSNRAGLTLLQIADRFGSDDKAGEWLEEIHWPNGLHCRRCGSFLVKVGGPHKSMTHRCGLRPAGLYRRAGRGAVGKTAVAGVRDRATGKVSAQVVVRTNQMAGVVQSMVSKRLRYVVVGECLIECVA